MYRYVLTAWHYIPLIIVLVLAMTLRERVVKDGVSSTVMRASDCLPSRTMRRAVKPDGNA